MKLSSILFLMPICSLVSCQPAEQQKNRMGQGHIEGKSEKLKTSEVGAQTPIPRSSDCLMQEQMVEAGLVDMKSVDPRIRVNLRYSTCNNFLGMDVYGDFEQCYLQPEVCAKLSCAQDALSAQFPYYHLIVFDAVRPRHIQVKMWDTIQGFGKDRSKYVSNPQNGSLHNYGAAVDLSIVDENGIELDMGTPYDYFGELAYPREEERMLKEGKLSRLQSMNRRILRDCMERSGFMGITTEWWHFNSCARAEASVKYTLVE